MERIPEPKATVTTSAWEDPMEVNWGGDGDDKDDDEPIVPEPKEAIFKCTALYSYTVWWFYYLFEFI